jgi:hypothetical protein
VVGVEAHSLALALAAHHYLREAHKADAGDVWPAEGGAWQAEPSSPMRMAAASWSRDQQAGHSAKAYLPATRHHLQQHLQHHDALLAGFGGWLARHAAPLLALVTAPGAAPPGKAPHPQGMVSAAELDRLGTLLRPPTHEEAEAAADPQAPPSGVAAAGGSSGRKRRMAEGGSPMDVCPTPFRGGASRGGQAGQAGQRRGRTPRRCLRRWPWCRVATAGSRPPPPADVRVSEHTPFFPSDAAVAYAPVDAVAAWLAEALRPADDTSGGGLAGGGGTGAMPRAGWVLQAGASSAGETTGWGGWIPGKPGWLPTHSCSPGCPSPCRPDGDVRQRRQPARPQPPAPLRVQPAGGAAGGAGPAGRPLRHPGPAPRHAGPRGGRLPVGTREGGWGWPRL